MGRQSLSYHALLGVSEDARLEEIESRYAAVSSFLSSDLVPPELREWAATQTELVEQAYALLLAGDADTNVDEEKESVPPPGPAMADEAQARGRRRRRGRRRAGQDPGRGRPASPSRRFALNPILVGIVLGAILVAGLLVGVSVFGEGDDGSAPAAGQQTARIDEKRMQDLIDAAVLDPGNTELLFEIAETYFQANQWEPAIEWFTRLVAIDPANVHAYTDIGTANYNLGRLEEAKTAWLRGLEVDPNDVQLNYNMGFFYATTDPQDLEAAAAAWNKVIELDPKSDLAAIARQHLQGLELPEGAPAGGASESGTATPPATITATPAEAATAGATP